MSSFICGCWTQQQAPEFGCGPEEQWQGAGREVGYRFRNSREVAARFHQSLVSLADLAANNPPLGAARLSDNQAV